MKERPILMSAPIVRALLDGSKTQTRRVVKPQPDFASAQIALGMDGAVCVGRYGIGLCATNDFGLATGYVQPNIHCRYGDIGDRLWVRETSRAEELPDDHEFGEDEFAAGTDGVRYLADNEFIRIENSRDASDKWVHMHGYAGKKGAIVPGIYMPRWASRITLEITKVRVERLQDISEPDAWAEGCEGTDDDVTGGISGYREYFELWQSINGPDSWDANPWVWVIEFKPAIER